MNRGSTNNYLLSGDDLKLSDAAAAIIFVDNERYLMQLRDNKPGIFYPEYWGLFGGAVDFGETFETALHREILEELDFLIKAEPKYFTEFIFDFKPLGLGLYTRRFYVIHVKSSDIDSMVLREGQEFRSFKADEILNCSRVVPYDSFALWMHARSNL